jgi:hypothetical protein
MKAYDGFVTGNGSFPLFPAPEEPVPEKSTVNKCMRILRRCKNHICKNTNLNKTFKIVHLLTEDRNGAVQYAADDGNCP